MGGIRRRRRTEDRIAGSSSKDDTLKREAMYQRREGYVLRKSKEKVNEQAGNEGRTAKGEKGGEVEGQRSIFFELVFYRHSAKVNSRITPRGSTGTKEGIEVARRRFSGRGGWWMGGKEKISSPDSLLFSSKSRIVNRPPLQPHFSSLPFFSPFLLLLFPPSMDRKRPHPDGVHEGDRKRRVSPSAPVENGGGSRASSSKARARAAMMPGDEEDGEMDSLSLKVEVSRFPFRFSLLSTTHEVQRMSKVKQGRGRRSTTSSDSSRSHQRSHKVEKGFHSFTGVVPNSIVGFLGHLGSLRGLKSWRWEDW